MSATTLARSSRLIPAAAGIVAAALLTVSPSPASAIDAVFDVTDYGATPNDATDDAPAFRSAIAAADAVAGSTVYVPAGTYLMDRPSDSVIGIVRMQNVTDVDVVGDGVTSVVKFKARNWSTGGDPHLFWCSGCSLVNFSDFTIDGSKSDAGFAGQEQMHGIFWLNSHDVTVQRMRFDDNFGDGVMTIGDGGTTQDVLVADNEFLNGGRSGIGVQAERPRCSSWAITSRGPGTRTSTSSRPVQASCPRALVRPTSSSRTTRWCGGSGRASPSRRVRSAPSR